MENVTQLKLVRNSKGTVDIVQWKRAGYEDFRLGLDYRPEYEMAKRHLQLNYEWGTGFGSCPLRSRSVDPDVARELQNADEGAVSHSNRARRL